LARANGGSGSEFGGIEKLNELLAEVAAEPHNWNEAETRLKIIDKVIMGCLGWPEREVTVERASDSEYTDYELGKPLVCIWEAKREGKTFELPVRISTSILHKISSIMSMSKDCREAILQVNGYCIKRGSEIGVATNGHQLVAFCASTDLENDSKMNCVVFKDLEHLQSNFPRAWQLLSPAGIAEGNLKQLISRSSAPQPPEKLSANIPNYPQHREPTDLQRSMMDIAELLLLNVEELADVESVFYKNCYCQSGALGQHALISKNILKARYASLFPDAEDAPQTSPVSAKGKRPQLTPEILAEAISNRPITLVGDVGVGKSSFLKHLMYVSAFTEFRNAVYVYVNLGRRGAFAESIMDLTLDQIEKSLIQNHAIDIKEASFVKSVYKDEIKRFERSFAGELKEINPEKYIEKLFDMINEHQTNRPEHLRRSIEYLSTSQKKQIIIAIDNADQRSTAIQQEAFIIAQNLAAEWRATVFISVRPKTFYLSKRSGSMSAYTHRIFTIAPPRIDEVIEKRLIFALTIAEGKVHLHNLSDISFRLQNIATLIRVLMKSIDRLDAVKIFLENITGGNIRELIQFIANMFGNPNNDLQGLVITLGQGGDYTIPLHEFWKPALKGNYQYFDSEKVIAANLFDVQSREIREHFLTPLILALLDHNSPNRSAEGFVDMATIVSEMQALSFTASSIESAIRKANNKKLIESPDRITFEEDEHGEFGLIPTSFRLNTLGAYHLKVWLPSFSYLDAVCVDTPIFDEAILHQLESKIRSFSLEDRYDRTVQFRDYLTQVWADMDISPSYFDWNQHCSRGQDSFEPVEKAVSRTKMNRPN
jgi:hypothetical protein